MSKSSIKETKEELKSKTPNPDNKKYFKICAFCKKPYWSNSRSQKYCCPEHQKLQTKKREEYQKEYSKNKEFQRLYSRYHALHVDTLKLLCATGVRKWQCQCCGKTEEDGVRIECHHKNLNWTDGTPSNLMLLCHKCHAKEHSRMEKELNEKGILPEEYVDNSFLLLYKRTTKKR